VLLSTIWLQTLLHSNLLRTTKTTIFLVIFRVGHWQVKAVFSTGAPTALLLSLRVNLNPGSSLFLERGRLIASTLILFFADQ